MYRLLAASVAALALVLAGCGGGDGSSGGGDKSSGDAEGEGVTLKVDVFDDTRSNAPGEKFEIWAKGHGSFFPEDVEFGSDTADMEIQGNELYVYPDGRDGTEFKVRLEPPDDLIESSYRDAITVKVKDSRVEVEGTSVPGLEQQHQR